MRGPAQNQLRSRSHVRNRVKAPTVPATVSAPLGGWNAVDPVSAMPMGDAVVLDNFFPGTADVKLRDGRSSYATGMAEAGRKFILYSGATSSKLFAATDAHIYNVSASGAVGASVASTTSGYWRYLNMATSGGNYMLCVNGVDKLKLYDGTTWTTIDGVSTPAITGVTTTTLDTVTLFKQRAWFIQKNTLDCWYLGTASIAGAATKFPMGAIFSKGGYLVAQATWTIDGGQGLDDYLVSVTSEGQLAVYQGTDPDDASTFALVGVFFVGPPIGKDCFLPFGEDILYLGKEGTFPLSKRMLNNQAPDRTQEITYKISGALQESIKTYSTNVGWGFTLHPTQNALILNIPSAVGATSYQYVMNTVTKAWCRFTGWDAADFITFNGSLYSLLGTKTYLTWNGLSDDGLPITGLAQQAYNKFGTPYQKSIELVRPNVSLLGMATLSLSLDSDYKLYQQDSQFPIATAGSVTSAWDAGIWDTSRWSATIEYISLGWRTVPSNVGFFHSFRLQISTSSAKFAWTSTDYALQRAGIL